MKPTELEITVGDLMLPESDMEPIFVEVRTAHRT